MPHQKILFLTMIALSLIFSGCFSPWAGGEQGTITISIGGNGQTRYVWNDLDTDNFLHIVTITGPGQEQEKRFLGINSSASFTVTTGFWHIDVKAYDGKGEFTNKNINDIEINDKWPPLVAEGSNDIDVKAGNNSVTITMGPPKIINPIEPPIEPPVEPPIEPPVVNEDEYNLIVGIITGQNGWQKWSITYNYNDTYHYGNVKIKTNDDKEYNDNYAGGFGNGGQQDRAINMRSLKTNDTVTITASARRGYKFEKWVTTNNINEDTFSELSELENKTIQDFEKIVKTTADGKKTITLYAVFDTEGSVAPKNITSVAELLKIGIDEKYPMNGNYALMTDLNITQEFTPIGGNGADAFLGNFDGRGHSIYLGDNKVKTTGSDNGKYAGLFAIIGDGGIVKNLNLDGKISIPLSNGGSLYAGAVAGENIGEIKNVMSSVIIEDDNNYSLSAGGITGRNFGRINNCVANDVGIGTATNSVQYGGGIVGNNMGIIERCVTSGGIYATNFAGGIAGIADNGTIENCVALNRQISANVTAGACGRIVGMKNNNVKLVNNYARNDMGVNGGNKISDDDTGIDGKDVKSDLYESNLWWSNKPDNGPSLFFDLFPSEDSPWYWGQPDNFSLPLKLWFWDRTED